VKKIIIQSFPRHKYNDKYNEKTPALLLAISLLIRLPEMAHVVVIKK